MQKEKKYSYISIPGIEPIYLASKNIAIVP
jgi:hypothetical protein